MQLCKSNLNLSTRKISLQASLTSSYYSLYSEMLKHDITFDHYVTKVYIVDAVVYVYEILFHAILN